MAIFGRLAIGACVGWRGNTTRPFVFALGNYTVKAGDPEANRWKTVTGVAAAVEQTTEVVITI